MSILGLLFAPTDGSKRITLEKRIILHPAPLNTQFHYLQYFSHSIKLLFYTSPRFIIIIILFCKLALTLCIPVVSLLFFCIQTIFRIYSSYTTNVRLILLHLVTGSARNVMFRKTLLEVQLLLFLNFNIFSPDFLITFQYISLSICSFNN